MIVLGGGCSRDGSKWLACRPRFLFVVQVLSQLFRRVLLDRLLAAHRAGELQFFDDHATLANQQAFARLLAPLRTSEWVVYCKRPFGSPKQVLLISRATPIASPSQTGAWSHAMTTASPSVEGLSPQRQRALSGDDARGAAAG
jgi:hypothetical protein